MNINNVGTKEMMRKTSSKKRHDPQPWVKAKRLRREMLSVVDSTPEPFRQNSYYNIGIAARRGKSIPLGPDRRLATPEEQNSFGDNMVNFIRQHSPAILDMAFKGLVPVVADNPRGDWYRLLKRLAKGKPLGRAVVAGAGPEFFVQMAAKPECHHDQAFRRWAARDAVLENASETVLTIRVFYIVQMGNYLVNLKIDTVNGCNTVSIEPGSTDYELLKLAN